MSLILALARENSRVPRIPRDESTGAVRARKWPRNLSPKAASPTKLVTCVTRFLCGSGGGKACQDDEPEDRAPDHGGNVLRRVTPVLGEPRRWEAVLNVIYPRVRVRAVRLSDPSDDVGIAASRPGRHDGSIRRPARPGAASTSRRHRKSFDEFRADFSGRGQPVRALKMEKSAPGGAVFGAVRLDRVSELLERDLGSAHQMRSAVDEVAVQESADLVRGERGGLSFAPGLRRCRRLMLLILCGRLD